MHRLPLAVLLASSVALGCDSDEPGRYSLLASATDDVPEVCRRWITGGKGPVTVAPGETVTADIAIDGPFPGRCYEHVGARLNESP